MWNGYGSCWLGHFFTLHEIPYHNARTKSHPHPHTHTHRSIHVVYTMCIPRLIWLNTRYTQPHTRSYNTKPWTCSAPKFMFMADVALFVYSFIPLGCIFIEPPQNCTRTHKTAKIKYLTIISGDWMHLNPSQTNAMSLITPSLSIPIRSECIQCKKKIRVIYSVDVWVQSTAWFEDRYRMLWSEWIHTRLFA